MIKGKEDHHQWNPKDKYITKIRGFIEKEKKENSSSS